MIFHEDPATGARQEIYKADEGALMKVAITEPTGRVTEIECEALMLLTIIKASTPAEHGKHRNILAGSIPGMQEVTMLAVEYLPQAILKTKEATERAENVHE